MDLPDDIAWYEALDLALCELDRWFSENPQEPLALLIHTESTYFDRVPADVSHAGGDVYRVDKYGQLSDVFTDLGVYGLSSLIGVPNEAVAKVVQAAHKGALRVAINAESSLRDILVPGTPFFELAAYQDTNCHFSATYSLECPEDVQRILDEAMRTRPGQPGADLEALKKRYFQGLGEALDDAQREQPAEKSRKKK
jgi:hypothetical protein